MSERATFLNLATATDAYEESAYVVRNGPADGPTGGQAIVTECALYFANTTNAAIAQEMTKYGHIDF